jgi:hypothetical protein
VALTSAAATTSTSLRLASYRTRESEPLGYMRDLFCLFRAPRQRVLRLAPAYWSKTLHQRDTHEKSTPTSCVAWFSRQNYTSPTIPSATGVTDRIQTHFLYRTGTSEGQSTEWR